jgi:hypothetical protein
VQNGVPKQQDKCMLPEVEWTLCRYVLQQKNHEAHCVLVTASQRVCSARGQQHSDRSQSKVHGSMWLSPHSVTDFAAVHSAHLRRSQHQSAAVPTSVTLHPAAPAHQLRFRRRANMSDSEDEGAQPLAPPHDPAALNNQDLPSMFWDTMPENPEEHPDYMAMQALAEESTPEERAENFKAGPCWPQGVQQCTYSRSRARAATSMHCNPARGPPCNTQPAATVSGEQLSAAVCVVCPRQPPDTGWCVVLHRCRATTSSRSG